MKPFLRKLEADSEPLKEVYAHHAQELQNLSENDGTRLLELLLLLGIEARHLNLLEDSKVYLKNALGIAQQQHRIHAELSAYIHLGICVQYLEELEEADEMFQKALKMTLETALESRRDEVLMAWGKLLAEQGKYDTAQTCFEEVLKLRQAICPDDQDKIDEVENALELLDALDVVDDKGYAVSYTDITHIETPDFDPSQTAENQV